MNEPRNSSRIAVLQVLRAVAALLVAQSHVVDVCVANHGRALQSSFGSFENFGAVGVDIFFVVSGFIVPLTALGGTVTKARFLLRRAVRIYPLWWCALLGRVLQIRLNHHWCDWHLLLHSALLLPSRNAAYTPIIYLGWSLIFEMFFYFLIVLAWTSQASLSRLRTILVVVLTLGLTGSIVRPIFPFSHFLMNPILLEFCGGLLAGILWTSERMPSCRVGRALLLLGMFLLLASGYLGFGQISEMQYIVTGQLSARRAIEWGIPATLIVLGALALSPSCTSRFGRLMVALGDASYSIYLTQFFTQLLLFTVWRFLARLPGDLAILVGVAVMGGIGLFVYRFLELPILDSLKPLVKRPVRRVEHAPAVVGA